MDGKQIRIGRTFTWDPKALLKCEPEVTRSASDPVLNYLPAKGLLASYLTSLSLSNLIRKIGINMLTLPTSQGLGGLNNTS